MLRTYVTYVRCTYVRMYHVCIDETLKCMQTIDQIVNSITDIVTQFSRVKGGNSEIVFL